MSWLSKNNPPRWRKIPKSEYHRAEAFLREREKFCVSASARFLLLGEIKGHVWQLPGPGGEISALLLHGRRTLFPVFGKPRAEETEPRQQIPGPRFLSRFLGKVRIHSVQGLRQDAELLEDLIQEQGFIATQRIDYDLMSLDNAPRPEAGKESPAGLILRPPLPEDEESLFALQAAYEQEEVLPSNSVFNPAACRLNLQKLLSREQVLVAELDGQVVGKINTSARSFSRYQIGGVYVRPDCRGLGIGAKMTSVFARDILDKSSGITLFVKKRNTAACKVYRKAGFSTLANYRISYY